MARPTKTPPPPPTESGTNRTLHSLPFVYLDETAPYIGMERPGPLRPGDMGEWSDLPRDRNEDGVLEFRGGPARAVFIELGISKKQWAALLPAARRKAVRHAKSLSAMQGALRDLITGCDEARVAKADELLDRVDAVVDADLDFSKGYQKLLYGHHAFGDIVYSRLMMYLQGVKELIQSEFPKGKKFTPGWNQLGADEVNKMLARGPIVFAPVCTAAHIESLRSKSPKQVALQLIDLLMPRISKDALGRGT